MSLISRLSEMPQKLLFQNDKNGNMFISVVPFQVGLMRQFLLSHLPQHYVCADYCRPYPEDLKIQITHHRKREQLFHVPSGRSEMGCAAYCSVHLLRGPAAHLFEYI